MKLKRFLFLIPILLGLIVSTDSRASHVPGGNITYSCVGPNQYQITLTLFEDCGTNFETSGPQTINITNTCGFGSPTSLSLTNTIFQQNVSQLCPSAIGQSECNGGNLPGVYMHQWTGTVTLPGPCANWTFSYSSCCRNTSTNLSGQGSYYWNATLNSALSPCNNSPTFTSNPIPYVCVGQSVCYSFGIVETDGDSLSYALVAGLTTGPATTVTYNAGYTAGAPIPGISIDPVTGLITFTPTMQGNYVVVVRITEYDANGNIIGTIMRDITFEVLNCNNQIVDCTTAGVITNIQGAVVQTGPTTLQMCEGASFSFDISFTDPNPGDVLSISTNIAAVLPGAVVTTTGTNPISATISWTPPPGSSGSNTSFFVTVSDNSCPVSGQQTIVYTMDVISGTVALPVVSTICGTQSVQLSASGGNTFTWSVLSGSPISVGSNFSCNPCANPVASPATTTVYVVTSDLMGACTNTDTVTVNVVPDFTYNITQSASSSCLQDPVNLNVSVTPSAPGYTYLWNPTTYMSPTTGPAVVVTPTLPGNYTYNVAITSPQGCIKTDSVTISVAPGFTPNASLIAVPDTIFCGDTSQLVAIVTGNSVPTSCGASLTGPCATTTNITVGTSTGSNSSTGYPSPYSHYWKNMRQQYLFTAAELNAMGFAGGKISAITWQTIAQNGAIATYPGYTIKMGCTNATSLTTTWQTGLTTVFGPTNITVVLGNNTHNFTTSYEWDGVSNLVVEVCYALNTAINYTNNWGTPWVSTPFNSSAYYYSDGTAACPIATASGVSTNRPITRFHTCSSTPNFNYTWSAPITSTNDTVMVNPCITTNYSVIVTDQNGGCSDTAFVTVYVNADCFPPNPVLNHVSCNGGSDGSITADMVGNTGPWTVNWFDGANNLIVSNTNITTSDQITGLSAGNYRIQIVDTSGCSKDTLVTITEPLPLQVNAGNDTLICINGTASLIAVVNNGTTPYAYVWDNGATTANQNVTPAVNTTYILTVTDANGCMNSDTVSVSINPPLNVTVSANDTVCPGFPASFTAEAAGGNGGPYNYVWTSGTTNVGTNPVLSIVPPIDGTTYTITATDNCGTPAAVNTVVAYLYPSPQPSFVSNIPGACYPAEITFTNTTDPALVGSVTWNFGDGGTSNSLMTATHTFQNPACYNITLTVTSPDGCVKDTTYNNFVCAYPYPEAAFIFGPQPTNLFAPTITFVNESSVDVVSNLWNFGGLDSSTAVNPSYTFSDQTPGNYNVTLYVVNQYGCLDSIVHTVIIDGIYTIYAPNAFTPDGDGTNDVFYVRGEGFDPEEFEFFIYTRWGELVFHSETIENGWDGSFLNQKAKSDVYVWRIVSKDQYTKQQYETFGHVTLIRYR